MRIKQARIASCLRNFRAPFWQKYGLDHYSSITKPAVFFGCYAPGRAASRRAGPDIHAILKHQALAVLIWGGSDALYAGAKCFRPVLEAGHVKHIAISRSISEDLQRLEVPHIHLPIFPARVNGLTPEPLGQNIYVYSSHGTSEVYGRSIVRAVKKRLTDFNFIHAYSTPPQRYTRGELLGIYRSCFIGLRLTVHDGLSNTVVELGLMGRKCIWNGWLTNAIPWKNAKDVAHRIRREYQKEGDPWAVAKGVQKDLELSSAWLQTEFYK